MKGHGVRVFWAVFCHSLVSPVSVVNLPYNELVELRSSREVSFVSIRSEERLSETKRIPVSLLMLARFTKSSPLKVTTKR